LCQMCHASNVVVPAGSAQPHRLERYPKFLIPVTWRSQYIDMLKAVRLLF
jgi:hypothetical protein